MFDGLLLFRPLSPILSESVMTEPDTMTYIRAGSCVRTCSSIRIYVWPDATVCVARCVGKKTLMFSKKMVMFLCKGRWNHPHQVGHSFFSLHPYILAKIH